jgi:hypothetical protein
MVEDTVKYDPARMVKTFVSFDGDMRRDFLRSCAWDIVVDVLLLTGAIAFTASGAPLTTDIWGSFARIFSTLLLLIVGAKVFARLLPLTRIRPCYTANLEEAEHAVQEPIRKSFSLTDVPVFITGISLSAGYALSFHNGNNYAWYALSVVVAFALGYMWNLCSFDLFPKYTDAAVYVLKDDDTGEDES